MRMPYKRRGRKAPLKGASGIASKAKVRTRPAKMANVEALAKSISRLKKNLRKNVELKKYSPASLDAFNVGQVNINATGAVCRQLDIVNVPSGVNEAERVGTEVKLIGLQMRFQIQQQSTAVFYNKLIVEVYRTPDFQISLANVPATLYEIDSISGVVDANSTRAKEYMKTYTRIAKKVVYLKQDQITSETVVKDFRMFIKQNQVLSYAGGSTGLPINYRYLVVYRCQNGNSNTSTASTLSTIPMVQANTGILVRTTHTDWYIDN